MAVDEIRVLVPAETDGLKHLANGMCRRRVRAKDLPIEFVESRRDGLALGIGDRDPVAVAVEGEVLQTAPSWYVVSVSRSRRSYSKWVTWLFASQRRSRLSWGSYSYRVECSRGSMTVTSRSASS